MSHQRQQEPWGGELRVPTWLRRLLRRPQGEDTPERARERTREALHPAQPDRSVEQNVEIALFGGFAPSHPGNREGPRDR